MESLISRIDALIAVKSGSWCRESHTVRVELKNRGRTQVVDFTRIDNQYVFRSVVLPSKQVTATDRAWRDLAYRAWRRNATKDLVTFVFDEKHSLTGVIETAAATLDQKELEMYVETLARECDRFEYALTGEDIE